MPGPFPYYKELPKELQLLVAKFLDVQTLCRLSQASKALLELITPLTLRFWVCRSCGEKIAKADRCKTYKSTDDDLFLEPAIFVVAPFDDAAVKLFPLQSCDSTQSNSRPWEEVYIQERPASGKGWHYKTNANLELQFHPALCNGCGMMLGHLGNQAPVLEDSDSTSESTSESTRGMDVSESRDEPVPRGVDLDQEEKKDEEKEEKKKEPEEIDNRVLILSSRYVKRVDKKGRPDKRPKRILTCNGPLGASSPEEDKASEEEPYFNRLTPAQEERTGCGNQLLTDDAILSYMHCWSLSGPNERTERAIMANEVTPGSVREASPIQMQLMQGLMTTSRVYCAKCSTELGWRFIGENSPAFTNNLDQHGRFGFVRSVLNFEPV